MNTEAALLQAVRDQIRDRCGYGENECEVEFDEQAPATVGQVYIAVCPGGWRPGPNNDNGGGVLDELIDVEVTCILRAANVPRDRKRSVFLDNLNGLNERLSKIDNWIHFRTEVMQKANALLESTQGFIEMLKFGGMEAKPRAVTSETFAAKSGENAAGLARTIMFRGARRIQERAQLK